MKAISPRWIFVLLTIDLSTLWGLQWAPFDSYPGQTWWKDLTGVLSLLVQLPGYLLLLGSWSSTESVILPYGLAFVVTFAELFLLARGFLWLRRRLSGSATGRSEEGDQIKDSR